MKIKLDFITNSSSSSYTCDICNNTESGMDIGISDVSMCECGNNHIFCQNHLIGDSKELLRAEEEIDEFLYSIPEKFCPVCQFKTVLPKDALAYLLLKHNLTIENVLEMIRVDYMNYNDFNMDIKNNYNDIINQRKSK
jgi:hypothetical protein